MVIVNTDMGRIYPVVGTANTEIERSVFALCTN
jgi:hypothetical protein